MSRKMAQKVIVPKKKNYVPKFLKQRDIGNFMSFWNHGPSSMFFSFLNSGTLIVKICASACLVTQHRKENPRKFHFGKKSTKLYHSLYSSTGQLQVAL